MRTGTRRALLGGLAFAGLLVLVATVVTIVKAPDATPLLLTAFLVVLVLIVLAEVLVVALDRRSA